MAHVPCHNSKASRGFHVETCSGVLSSTQWLPVCKLGTGLDVYHVVTITNTASYPIDVVCDGSIDMATPPKVKFNSPDSKDTDHSWHVPYQNPFRIDINRQKTISHVQLEDRKQGPGPEDVKTEVSATLVNFGTSLQPIKVYIITEVP